MRTVLLVASCVAVAACSGEAPVVPGPDAFRVTFVGQPNLGSADKPLPFVVDKGAALPFHVDIEATDRGAFDPTFNGWVVLTVRPICSRFEDQVQRFVKLTNGRASNAEIKVFRVAGSARIVARDVGYVEARNLASAACNNGLDDDGDGFIDNDDRGCYVSSDDTETGGAGGTGATEPILIANPTMAQVQEPVLGETGNGSPLDTCQVMVDRGWLVVTRLTNDGMYLTDYSKVTWDASGKTWNVTGDAIAYGSLFAYNYSTPINLQEGDCLVQLDGQVDEFFGFTELGKPTWKKGDFGYCGVKGYLAGLTDVCPSKAEAGDCCDRGCVAGAQARGLKDAEVAAACCKPSTCPTDFACIDYKCRPDPQAPRHRLCRQRIEGLANTPAELTTLMLKDAQGVDRSVWNQTYMMTERFESALVQVSNVNVFTEARHCDVDGDFQINYADDQEKQCANNCGTAVDCVVWETFNRYSQWSVSFKDGEDKDQELNINTLGAIEDFDPLKLPGSNIKTLSKVVGNLRHLIFGRPPWILMVRSAADCPDCKHN